MLSYEGRNLILTGILSLLVTISAESLGPPKMSRGTIDWRYPDEIVSPLPACPREGVYPHPVNCTWYYRCHDRLGLGFFYRTYYECETGTVFSDDLDQCVFPHNVPPPCGIYQGSITSGPLGPPPTSTYVTPNPNTTQPEISPPSAPGTQKPTSKPDQGTTSEDTDITTTEEIESSTTTEITIIFNGPLNGSLTSTNTPVTIPNTEKPIPDQLKCDINHRICHTVEICPANTQNKFSWQLCESYQVCFREGREVLNRRVCPSGSFFNPQYQKCYFAPQQHDLCDHVVVNTLPPVTELPQPPVTVSQIGSSSAPTVITFKDENKAQCSADNIRPNEDWIRRKFCNYFAICDQEGVFVKQVQLCSRYYQCFLENNDWKFQEMECDNSRWFNFEDDQCVEQPNKDDLCFTFLRNNGLEGVPVPYARTQIWL